MTNDCKKMKRALIVTALARFTKSFLTNDIITLQKMVYEVHCAANINHADVESAAEVVHRHGAYAGDETTFDA